MVQFLGCSAAGPDAVDKVNAWLSPAAPAGATSAVHLRGDHSIGASSIHQGQHSLPGGNEHRHVQSTAHKGVLDAPAAAGVSADTRRRAPGALNTCRSGEHGEVDQTRRRGQVEMGGLHRAESSSGDGGAGSGLRSVAELLRENHGCAAVQRLRNARRGGGGMHAAAARRPPCRAAGKDISNHGQPERPASRGVRAPVFSTAWTSTFCNCAQICIFYKLTEAPWILVAPAVR